MKLLAALVFASTAAAASEAVPLPFIDRPLTLPAGVLQAQAGYEGFFVSGDGGSASAHSAFLGIEGGAGSALTLGAAATALFSPSFEFDRAAARALFAVASDAAVRVDGGVYRYIATGAFANGATTETQFGFVGGLGLALRARVTPWLTVFSGRGAGMGLPPLRAALAFDSDDLVTVDLNGSNDYGTIGLPAGVLVEVLPNFALQARVAVRHLFGTTPNGVSVNAVPLAADALFSLGAVDLIATFELPGETDAYTNFFIVRGTLQARF